MESTSKKHRPTGKLFVLVVAVLVSLAILACRGEQSDQAPVITVNPEATSTPVSAVSSNPTAEQDRSQRKPPIWQSRRSLRKIGPFTELSGRAR